MSSTVAAVRQLDTRDRAAAARLLDETLASTPYRDRAREILEAALHGDPEWLVAGVFDQSLGVMAAFGPILGAYAVWRLGFLVFASHAARRETARHFIAHIIHTAHSSGARTLIAELPADDTIGFALTSLRANGFRQEARIPDFYRDGVAQLFLRRDINAGGAPRARLEVPVPPSGNT